MKPALTVLIALLLSPLAACGDVRVETVNLPMRDGVKLATDVYRDDAVSKAPAILMRTPYDRTNQKGNAEQYVAEGLCGRHSRLSRHPQISMHRIHPRFRWKSQQLDRKISNG